MVELSPEAEDRIATAIVLAIAECKDKYPQQIALSTLSMLRQIKETLRLDEIKAAARSEASGMNKKIHEHASSEAAQKIEDGHRKVDAAGQFMCANYTFSYGQSMYFGKDVMQYQRRVAELIDSYEAYIRELVKNGRNEGDD